MRTVTADDIEAAERQLSERSPLVGVGLNMQFSRAGVRRDGFERYLSHHHETLRRAAPDLDPRLQPTIDTLLLHFFLCGVLCGRATS